MKKQKLLVAAISMLLVSCGGGGNTASSLCDPDDLFCEDSSSSEEKKEVKIELATDTRKSYQFDTSVTNENASVNYEVFVRSFYDSNGDGIGDLKGLESKLDYLQDLGVKNLWLMPINSSPSYHGYDVSDYYSVQKEYGTNQDLKDLIDAAKEKNMGIILDFVINHTSTENSWFKKSFSDYVYEHEGEDSYADWYTWSEESVSNGAKYTEDGITKYYSTYGGYSGMPQLNLASKSLRKEIEKICKYYIDMGITGFRLDATSHYSNIPDASDTEADRGQIGFLRWLNTTCKTLNPDFHLVGECWENKSVYTSYYKSGVDSMFNFASSIEGSGDTSIISVTKGITKANSFAFAIETLEKDIKANNPNAVNSYFLSNHDMDRTSKNLVGYAQKAAASLTYLLPGTPYIYYGEEIGLKGVRTTSPDDGSDAKRRLPLIWSNSDKTGQTIFPERNRLDLDNTDQVKQGVYDLLNTDYSLTNHYKKVLNVRNKYPFIRDAEFINLTNLVKDQDSKVLVYELKKDDKSIVVVHNFNSKAVKVDLGTVGSEILDEINTDKKIPVLENHQLSIGQYSTVILKK